MRVYISIASDKSYAQVMMVAQGDKQSDSKALGDVVHIVGEGGDKGFMGWSLDDILALGEGQQDIVPKKIRKRYI